MKCYQTLLHKQTRQATCFEMHTVLPMGLCHVAQNHLVIIPKQGDRSFPTRSGSGAEMQARIDKGLLSLFPKFACSNDSQAHDSMNYSPANTTWCSASSKGSIFYGSAYFRTFTMHSRHASLHVLKLLYITTAYLELSWKYSWWN